MPDHYRVEDETSPLGGGLGGHLAGGCHRLNPRRVCSRPALVATIYGATGGVLGATVSLTVNNALFEISVVPYFAIVIGLVLMMLGGTMAQVGPGPRPGSDPTPALDPDPSPGPGPDPHPNPDRGPGPKQRAMEEAHEALQTRLVKAGWAAVVLLAGASCFLLERHWNATTSPAMKTPIYMVLGAALSFTVSISLVDLIHMGASCCVRLTPSCAPPQMDSPAQMVAGFVGAVAMGAMFGVVFGMMDVMQDAPGQMERLRAEQRASLPVGVGMGAALGVILSQLGEAGEEEGSPGQRVYMWTRVARTAARDSAAAEGAGL